MATENRHITRIETTQALFRANGDHGQSAILTDVNEEWTYWNSAKNKQYYVANQYYWNGAATVYCDVDFNDIEAHGDILVDEYIKRSAGTDDSIRFENDKITIAAGGTDAFVFEDDHSYTDLDLYIDSDSNGLVVGEDQDMRLFYDSANTVFRTLTGTANYIFDGYTTVQTNCTVAISAGTTKDPILDFDIDGHSQAGDSFRFRGVYNATSANNLFKLQNDNAVINTFVDLMIVTPAGFFGFGTTAAASYKMHVQDVTLARMLIENTGDDDTTIYLDADRANANTILGQLSFRWNNTAVSTIVGYSGSDTVNKDSGYLAFETRNDDVAMSEKVRITGAGNVGIGTVAPLLNVGSASGDFLYSYTFGMHIKSDVANDQKCYCIIEGDSIHSDTDRGSAALMFADNTAAAGLKLFELVQNENVGGTLYWGLLFRTLSDSGATKNPLLLLDAANEYITHYHATDNVVWKDSNEQAWTLHDSGGDTIDVQGWIKIGQAGGDYWVPYFSIPV